MDISKVPTAENWRKIVSRGKYPLLFSYELNNGLKNTHKVTGFKFKMQNYCRFGGSSYVYEPEILRFIKETRKILKHNPDRTLSWLEKFYDHTRRFLKWAKETNRRYLDRNLDKAALKNIYREYTERSVDFWQWAYLPYIMDDAINAEINDLLLKLGAKPSDIPNILKTISVNENDSLIIQQEVELIKLSKLIKKIGIKRSTQKLADHLKEWGWIDSWVYTQNPVNESKIRNEISKIIKQDPDKVLAKLKNDKIIKISEKTKCLAVYHNEKLNKFAEILSQYSIWHSTKIEEITRIVYIIKPILEKLAPKLGLTYNQLIELTPEEVEQEKINFNVIAERSCENGVLMLNNKLKTLNPKEIEVLKKIVDKNPSGIKELKGFVVYPGNITGKVKIVPAGDLDLSKIKITKGNILVAAMTTTNMVPLVKVASAIITDEGGILSHASIIARELRKPCIIGTKIATKVLKDDMWVIINSETGRVKILGNK